MEMNGEDIPNFTPSYSFDVDANSVINLKLVRDERDFDNQEIIFRPEYTHQIFGQDERILGYHGLQVDVFYNASTLDVFLGMRYERKANPLHCPMSTTPIKFLTEIPLSWESNEVDQYKVINHEYFSDPEVFKASLKKRECLEFRPPGTLVHSYMYGNRDFEIYRGKMSDDEVRNYHMRFQTFLLFYIETLSYLDDSDELWEVYLLFEKVQNRRFIVGYVSVYPFFAYPDKTRFRVSQFLVLPPFQRQGHGRALLQAIFREGIRENGKVVEVTVEGPSEGMEALMNRTDFHVFHKTMENNHEVRKEYYDDALMKNGFHFSREFATKIRKLTMIPESRVRKSYEIYKYLKLFERKFSDENRENDQNIREDMKKFRLEVKRRLFNTYQLRKAILDDESRKRKLQEIWEKVSKDYKRILKRYIPNIPKKQKKMKDEDDEEEEEEEIEGEENQMNMNDEI